MPGAKRGACMCIRIVYSQVIVYFSIQVWYLQIPFLKYQNILTRISFNIWTFVQVIYSEQSLYKSVFVLCVTCDCCNIYNSVCPK